MEAGNVWASFCMSTYKRPSYLKHQIESLLKQSFLNFEIVISDNDPDASGKAIAGSFADNRVKYFCNGENLGMVKSFNRSIERASGKFVVMVTDDDPVQEDMLDFFSRQEARYPDLSVYCGLKRAGKKDGDTELINAAVWPYEILHPRRTLQLHWSSFLISRKALLETGKLADFGSGHLVDHLMMAMTGSINGALIVNRQFSSIQLHEANYSKTNFENYYISCKGFYEEMKPLLKSQSSQEMNEKAVDLHLKTWFISCFFAIRKFYYLKKPQGMDRIIMELDLAADKILNLPYMKRYRMKYSLKKIIFNIKYRTGVLRIVR